LVMYLVRDRVLLFSVGLILLFVVGLVKPVSAFPAPLTAIPLPVSLSANPSSITVTAGSSASTTITVTFSTITPAIPDGIGSIQLMNPVISCSGLPAGATCSTIPNPLPSPMSSGEQFTLTVSASSSTAPGTYQVTVQISYQPPTVTMIQPSFLAISPIQFGSSGGIGPSAISISQTIISSITITVVVKAPTFPAVHPTPVGGVMLPSVGFTALLPWAVLLSLLGVLSVEAFTIKRRAKRR